MPLQSIDPATNTAFAEFAEASPEDVDRILEAVDTTTQAWHRTAFADRSTLMRAAASTLRAQAAELAELMVREMGKPILQAKAEVEKCAWVCDYYADHAEGFLSPEVTETDASKSYVAFRPIGVVLAVMPWNFPLWQVIRFAAPALMAGNGAVLKHASNVTGCAFAIERVFREAGFPESLFRVLPIGAARVADVIRDRRIRAVTLTGSGPAGSAVAGVAGTAVKKTVLELGGSDPYVILEDADLEQAAHTCATSRLINTGQSCVAAKRFIVVDSVRKAFERLFVERMSGASMGDPLDEKNDIGPMARVDLRDELHDQIVRSEDAGARVLIGGSIPDQPGAYYPPTVLTDVQPGMPAYDEELFGPAAAIISATDETDAIRIANDSIFGLGAAVFTQDVARGERIARDELEAGACFVNAFVKSDPRLPFGGVKASGYGRELACFGIREFVNIKTVYIQ
jgi:succinate-semialdehyde dehydrogenase/glutarate-semialdehyde dehydrogenase